MKKILSFAAFCLFLFTNANGQTAIIKVHGDVIAYEKNDDHVGEVTTKLTIVPDREVLFLRVKNSKKIKERFIKVIYEYFDKKPFSNDIYSGKDSWIFRVSRRLDCDSVLNPDYSNLKFSNNDGEEWIADPPAEKIILSKEVENIPPDKVLPCYSLEF